MLAITSLLAVLGAIPVFAALAVPREENLEPWQVTHVSVSSPPAFQSQPPLRSYLSITIADPNTIDAVGTKSGMTHFPPSIAHCNVSWYGQDGEHPYDQTRNCTLVDEAGYPAKWSFIVLPADREHEATNGGPPTDFLVQFTLLDEMFSPVISVRRVYSGEGHFAVGQNMEGICGASGVCGFNLENDSVPVLVKQTRVECIGPPCQDM